jgi:hypothetical protein
MRREYTDLSAIIERLVEINGGRQGLNAAPPAKLRIDDQRLIELGSAQRPGDERSYMGQPHDLIAIDEAAQFQEQQVRFLLAWNRTTTPGQRCRAILASNPPLVSEGLWLVQMFRPWLDPAHPNPAKSGELRWFTTINGEDTEVDGPGPHVVDGKPTMAKSRTFIPSELQDNPFLRDTNYQAQLNALPEVFKSILLGGFQTRLSDAPNQVIPTSWIKAAQKRWRPQPPRGIPMCVIGVDMSGGGKDPLVLASRYDGWYAPLVVIPGKELPAERIGTHAAGIVVSHRRNQAVVVVDLGGGYGASLFEHLKVNDIETIGYRGMEGSRQHTRQGRLKFYNMRSEALWRFREALDPAQPGGSPIMLPDDPILVADLASPCLDLSFDGIKVESKEGVCTRLGRSTDHGDAVVMAWTAGAKNLTPTDWPEEWHRPRVKRRPEVILRRPRGR